MLYQRRHFKRGSRTTGDTAEIPASREIPIRQELADSMEFTIATDEKDVRGLWEHQISM